MNDKDLKLRLCERDVSPTTVIGQLLLKYDYILCHKHVALLANICLANAHYISKNHLLYLQTNDCYML